IGRREGVMNPAATPGRASAETTRGDEGAQRSLSSFRAPVPSPGWRPDALRLMYRQSTWNAPLNQVFGEFASETVVTDGESGGGARRRQGRLGPKVVESQAGPH